MKLYAIARSALAALLFGALGCGSATVQVADGGVGTPDGGAAGVDGAAVLPDAASPPDGPDASLAGADAASAGRDAGVQLFDGGGLPATAGAFPGCEGSGCLTRGGFDTSSGTPTIYRITTTDDAKTGCVAAGGKANGCALRDCIEASGPRVCVFAVAGRIHTAGLVIRNPFITIRGDTAPGQGIHLDAEGISELSSASDYSLLYIRRSHVVVRGLRMRVGINHPTNDYQPYLLWPSSSSDDIHHVVLDHISSGWGNDDNGDVYGGAGPGENQPRQLTLSWNTYVEGLDKPNSSGESSGESRGPMQAADQAEAEHMTDIDFHHNFLASNFMRNPMVAVKTTRLVNNLLFNWAGWGISLWNGVNADVINNLGMEGPYPAWTYRRGFIGYYNDDATNGPAGPASIYLAGNKYHSASSRRQGGAELGWYTNIITEDCPASMQDAVVKRSSPMPPPASGTPITASDADELPSLLLGPGGAGHSRRLDCGGRWVAEGVRDPVDERVMGYFPTSVPAAWVRQTQGGAGAPIDADDPLIAPGWPAIPAVSAECAPTERDNASCACADADADGMPDYWESHFCGGATACAPLGTELAAPWTNLEAFMSGMKAAP